MLRHAASMLLMLTIVECGTIPPECSTVAAATYYTHGIEFLDADKIVAEPM